MTAVDMAALAPHMPVEPWQIKKALPIPFVLEYCGISLSEEEGRLVALCPFHPDSDPSFDVYAYKDGVRWGCWACGIGGDVLDLVQRIWPELSFPRAKEACVNLIEELKKREWNEPQLKARRAWDPASAGRAYARAVWDAGSITDFLSRRGSRITADWLLGCFGVRVLGRELVVPYWHDDGTLFALKHRGLNGGSPIAMVGSQLTGNFYGEWLRHTDESPVMLCEGESDTWTAAYYYGDKYWTLGLPSGAASSTSGAARLAGRQVLLCFDGDPAGWAATERWQEALNAVGCVVSKWEMPAGMDLSQVVN